MSPHEMTKRVVGGLSVAWICAFVGAFVAAFAMVWFATGEVQVRQVLLVFVAGQVLAGLLAICAAIAASGNLSPSVQRRARLPLMGTGLMALVAVSMGMFSVVLT